jgi:hypothetical protein
MAEDYSKVNSGIGSHFGTDSVVAPRMFFSVSDFPLRPLRLCGESGLALVRPVQMSM